MKKVSRVMVVFLALAMLCTLVACGGGKTVQSYLDAQKDQIEAMKSAMGDSMQIDVEAKDDSTMLYRYTIPAGTPFDAEASEQALDGQKATYDAILEEMRTYGIKDPVIELEYYDDAGTELLTKSFS